MTLRFFLLPAVRNVCCVICGLVCGPVCSVVCGKVCGAVYDDEIFLRGFAVQKNRTTPGSNQKLARRGGPLELEVSLSEPSKYRRSQISGPKAFIQCATPHYCRSLPVEPIRICTHDNWTFFD